MTIKDYLIKHEGFSLNIYHDMYGNQTIGVGRNLDSNGITKDEAFYLLNNDIDRSIADLKTIFPDWVSISSNRQMVLVDMRFQLGRGGFRYFKKFIAAVKIKDWKEAGRQIVDSNYYKQVTSRAKENINFLREG